jgi:hypothetical protein
MYSSFTLTRVSATALAKHANTVPVPPPPIVRSYSGVIGDLSRLSNGLQGPSAVEERRCPTPDGSRNTGRVSTPQAHRARPVATRLGGPQRAPTRHRCRGTSSPDGAAAYTLHSSARRTRLRSRTSSSDPHDTR